MTKKNIKEKLFFVVNTMEIEKGQTKFSYFKESMYNMFNNDPDLPIIEQKMENLVSLMEKTKKDGKFEELLDKDFEDEIWDMI